MACGQWSACADLSFTAPPSVGAGRHPAWNAWRGRFQSWSACADLSLTAPRSVGAGRHPAWNAWRGRFQSGDIL